MARLPEITSVIVPVTRVPIGTTTRSLTRTACATVASKVSPGCAVFVERSDDKAIVTEEPLGTVTRNGGGGAAGFGGAALATLVLLSGDLLAAFFAAAAF